MRLWRRWGGPIRRALFGPPAVGGVWGAGRPRQVLQRANVLMVGGQPREAAALYDELAQIAEAHTMPRRAALLHIQAARAWLAAGDGQAAIERAKRGFGAFIALGQGARVARLLPEVTARLRQRGYAQAADALERDLQAQLAHAGIDPASVAPAGAGVQQGVLPASCPHCGAPLRPDEVEWVDAASAECPYCGMIVKAE